MIFRKLLLLAAIFSSLTQAFSQEEDPAKIGGQSIFLQYDKSHITPELRRKHAIVVGGQQAVSTPFSVSWPENEFGKKQFKRNLGFHISYNYLILKRRVRALSPNGKMVTEIKNGIGIHFMWQENNEFYLNFNYYRPLIHLYIPLFRFYFFNEFGIGLHYNSNFADFAGGESRALSPVASIEAVRIRLSNSPIYFHATSTYALRNNSFSKSPMSVSFLFGCRIYFYKYG